MASSIRPRGPGRRRAERSPTRRSNVPARRRHCVVTVSAYAADALGSGMDAELIERARSGDHEAFQAIVVAVADRLMGIAFGILRDRAAAEDAVQASIVAAWRDIHSLRDPSRFDAWIGRILVRACYASRRDSVRQQAVVRLMPPPGSDPDLLAGLVRRDTLERAFRHLPIDQRVILVYRFFLDLPVERIAIELGLPAGTVKSRLHYATIAMRAAIEADARRPLAQGVTA